MKLSEICKCTNCPKKAVIGAIYPIPYGDDSIHKCECGGTFRAFETKEDLGFPDPNKELFTIENLRALDNIVAAFEAGDPDLITKWNVKTIDSMRRTIFESITGLRNTYWRERALGLQVSNQENQQQPVF